MSKPNRPWELTAGREPTLRIGKTHVKIADIKGVGLAANEERDVLPSLFNYTCYLLVSAVFLILVVHAGWRERFLLATLFFAIVGFTSLIDIVIANRVRLYRLRISIVQGGVVEFVSSKPAEVDALFAALRHAGKA